MRRKDYSFGFFCSDEGLIQEFSGASQATRTYGWNPGGLWEYAAAWESKRMIRKFPYDCRGCC